MNESSDKKVDTSYKKCSRPILPFAPLNEEDAPQKAKSSSAFFYHLYIFLQLHLIYFMP